MSNVFVGDIGTEILLNTGVDITQATVKKMVVLKPDGSSVEWEASAVNTTYLKYTTSDGDLDVAGKWKIQSKVTLTAWSGVGDIATFQVNAPLG